MRLMPGSELTESKGVVFAVQNADPKAAQSTFCSVSLWPSSSELDKKYASQGRFAAKLAEKKFVSLEASNVQNSVPILGNAAESIEDDLTSDEGTRGWSTTTYTNIKYNSVLTTM